MFISQWAATEGSHKNVMTGDNKRETPTKVFSRILRVKESQAVDGAICL